VHVLYMKERSIFCKALEYFDGKAGVFGKLLHTTAMGRTAMIA
jgi:hypothetical protein